jgi:DNA-binding response OmpR family regulator
MSTTPKTLAHLRRELHTPLNHIIGFSKMLLAKLREMPHVGTTPVIIVTAADLSDQERRRLQKASRHVLQKAAYGQDELLAEIRGLIGRYAVAAERVRGA